LWDIDKLIVTYANGNRNNKGHDADPCNIVIHLPVLSMGRDISHIKFL
jgi:hypothetical protein